MSSKSAIRSYANSPELEEIYKLLYPQGDFHAFIQREASLGKLNIDDSQADVSREPDFPLRQFLWFIRPAPDFIAFNDFSKWWKEVFLVHKHWGLKDRIPWCAINNTIQSIVQSIETFQFLHPNSKLFPKQSVSKTSEDEKFDNPMLGHSASDFPLYTLFLDDPDKDIFSQEIRELFFQNVAYVLVREAEQRKISASKQHKKYRNPYQFLKRTESEAKETGLSPLCNVERALRRWSKKDNAMTSFVKTIAPLLRQNDYEKFLAECAKLKKNQKSLDDNSNSKDFLQFFASDRQSRTFTSKQGSGQRNSIGSLHYWRTFHDANAPEEEIHEDLGEHLEAIPEISSNQENESWAAGEDPYEDISEIPLAEIVFLDKVLASQLKLNQHTSHQQQLMATLNQRLWWAQTDLTAEDMGIFHQYLHKNRSSAADVLKIVLYLGVDIDFALHCHLHIPITNPQWILGATQIPFSLHQLENRLVVTSIDSPHNPTYVWSLSIQSFAYQKSTNLRESKQFEGHTSYIAFKDQSGLIEDLMRRHIIPTGQSSIPLFANLPDLKQECLALIEHFHWQFNRGASRPLEKRHFSIQKIQAFYHAKFLKEKVDSAMIDWLNRQTPFKQIPTLHYYTQSLHQAVSKKETANHQQRIGLQYALSNLTGMFRHQKDPTLPPTKYITIGAPELVKVQVIKEFIAQLQNSIEQTDTPSKKRNYADFEKALNSYSLYMMLWFCFETSHRPHHIPYANVDEIDYLHGIIKLKDKSPMGGEKYRLSFVSPELRQAMRHYAQTLDLLQFHFMKFGHTFSHHHLCVFLESSAALSVDKRRKASFKYQPQFQIMDAQQFRKQLQSSLSKKIAPNFYRKLMVSLLKERAVSLEDIRHWLGHSVHGTAPFHEFSTHNHLSYCLRIQKPLSNIISDLGFKPMTLKLPRRQ